MKFVLEYWTKSRTYRILLILAVIAAVAQLALQVYLFADVMAPTPTTPSEEVSADLQLAYIAAAQRFQARQDLYAPGGLEDENTDSIYMYSPAFAFFFTPFLLLPLQSLLPLMVIIHVAVYALLYIWWGQIFEQSNLFSAARQWALILPLYLLFSAFWDDLGYLNIYILMALFATFAIEAVLYEKLGWAVFWLGAVILPIKPHWAFALALPLLLGRYRFFLKLLAGTALAYLLVAAITITAGGFGYGLEQYRHYLAFLANLSHNYPWWGPDKPFLGYNHSILQIVMYYFGVSPASMTLATILKVVLILPLGWISYKFLRHPGEQPGSAVPGTALALVFAFYLAAFIWLDMVWELSLSIVIFAYLLATTPGKQARVLVWVLFVPYALLDVWRIISYAALGDSVFYNDAYVLTDPFIYVPWIMAVLLAFYALLLLKMSRIDTSSPAAGP